MNRISSFTRVWFLAITVGTLGAFHSALAAQVASAPVPSIISQQDRVAQATRSGEPSGRTQTGLEVTRSGAGTVSGSFTKGGETIYFEAVRGPANELGDPDAPLYALDIRILDRDRTPFLVQTAGQSPIAPSWYADKEKSESLPIDTEERQRAFAMLPKVARALKGYAKQGGEPQWEIKQIVALLESVSIEDMQDFDTAPHTSVETPQATAVAPQATTVTTYTHKATIRKKSANIVINKEFEHSAVLLQIYKSGGALLTQYSTCNHGACATDSSMSTQCTSSFTKTNVSFNVWDLMCDYYGSPYVLHLCNSDTLQEYLSIKGSSSKNWGVCFTPRVYAPSCQ